MSRQNITQNDKSTFMKDIAKINVEFRKLKPQASKLHITTINLLLFNSYIQ